MEKVTKPRVRSLATGTDFVAKQMEGKAGDLLPLHSADIESIMFIHEGACYLKMNNEDILLQPGDAHIIPADVKHQFKVTEDLKGVHFMPRKIKIEFFDM